MNINFGIQFSSTSDSLSSCSWRGKEWADLKGKEWDEALAESPYIAARCAMRAIVITAVVAGLALVSSGCIIPKPKSGSVMVAPDVRGRVVDSVTGKPVAGAHVMVGGRPETMVVSGDDGSFHVEELRKKYVVEFIDPGGVMGYCPPLGEIAFRLDVTHPACQDLHLWIREHLAESPPNHDGPFVIRDVQLISRER